MAPPRIVIVYVEPTPYVVALVDALRRVWSSPIETYYMTTDLSQPWALRLDPEQGRVFPVGFFRQLRVVWRAMVRDRKNTILHLQGWGLPVLFAAMLMARSLRIPLAVESDTAEGRWDRHWRTRVIKKLLYPFLFQLPDRFLPAGTRQAGYLTRFGAKEERIRTAQMTVDVCAIRRFCATGREAKRAAARTRWGMSADERIVLYVGRLEEYKGIKLLLSAFQRLAGEEGNLRLAIAGSGTLRTHVEAIAADADCRVTYLGRLSGDDVLRAYLAADFLVLPSLFEPWGLVVNEAMACGLPVIVSDRVGCADDLVRPGETGLMVAAGREIELAEAIRRLAGDAAVRGRMGQAADALIAHWTLDREAQNIASAWREMAR